MEARIGERERQRRRWNAAAVQQHLKRRARKGMSTHPGDVFAAAHELRADLRGSRHPAELLQEAVMDLVVLGLIAVTPLPTGGSAWRPLDVPTQPSGHTKIAHAAGVWL